MKFEAERLINKVFETCCAVYAEKGSFNAETIITKLDLLSVPDKESDYWQKENIKNSLTILEKVKLIAGSIKPEYTDVGCLKKVRYGTITTLGKRLPKMIRLTVIAIYRRKQKFLATLGVLSFVPLIYKAYIGVVLLSSWIEHIAVIIIFYILLHYFFEAPQD